MNTTEIRPTDILREVYRFAELHEIDKDMSSVSGLIRGKAEIQLWKDRNESTIAALLPWARALGRTDVVVEYVDENYHVMVRGELPSDIPVSVVVITRDHETGPLAAARVMKGDTLTLDQLAEFVREPEAVAR